MNLSNMMIKKSFKGFATAIPAIPATKDRESGETVAEIAKIAVATYQSAKPEDGKIAEIAKIAVASTQIKKTITALANTLAAELKTTTELCLSLLDDGDRQAILTGSDPDRLNAWRGFAELAIKKAGGRRDH